MDSISFPPVNYDTCKHLVQLVFDAYNAQNPNSLGCLELRFARRCWYDRGQFRTGATSVYTKKFDNGTKIEVSGGWKEYLPQWPRDGILKQLSDQGLAEHRGNR